MDALEYVAWGDKAVSWSLLPKRSAPCRSAAIFKAESCPERRISSMARTTGQNVERKAEAGPPYRDAGIVNEQVMKKVENTMSDEASHDQPQVLLKAYDGYREKSGGY
ncbi:MAG TPA: hypothetical protein VFE61_27600 [Candidatus Sulfotelmatobacter sp.]|nr:hypothetical protein [Candidatus Sulfotelmatobacter sp.]